MSYDLKIVNGDIQISKDGALQIVSGNSKLRQDIIKILLTNFGDNKFHQNYGSAISSIGIADDQYMAEAELKSAVISSLNNLIQMQKSQMKRQTVSPSETIVSILNVEASRDTIDPRLLNIKLSVLTQQLVETFDNITIRIA